MQFNEQTLCDFCFEPMEEGEVCKNCGLTHETYHLDGGLLAPGSNLLGKYIIGKSLGRGGFGATYLAYSGERGERVAIKEYFPTSILYRAKGEENVSLVSEDMKEVFDKGAERFFDEAKVISRFNANPNIVSVYEFFNANSTVYYSMEYLEGTDLKGYINSKGGRLEESEVITITKSVCNALMGVHSAQVLHRDISPDNIYMCADGGIKLIDFGAAKQVIANENQSYSVVVKQGFAPAEQYTRKGNQGVWTDVYALGATMYYTLLGRVPPGAIDRVDEPELNFTTTYPDVTNNFCAVINKCMAMQKELRYQSVMDLLADLDRLHIPDAFPTTSMVTGLTSDPTENGDVGKTMAATMPLETEVKKPSGIFANKKLMAIIGGSVAACLAVGIGIYTLIPKSGGGMSGGGGGGGGGATAASNQQLVQPQTPESNSELIDPATQIALTEAEKAEQEAQAKTEQEAQASAEQPNKQKTTSKKTAASTKTESKTQSMSSNNKITNSSATTTQTSKPSTSSQTPATKKNESKTQTSVNVSTPKPTTTPGVASGSSSQTAQKQTAQKQEVPKQEPVKQEPVKQEPVKQEPVKQEPVKQEQPKQETVKQEQPKPEPSKPASDSDIYIPPKDESTTSADFDPTLGW